MERKRPVSRIGNTIHMARFDRHMTFCGKDEFPDGFYEGTWKEVTCFECVVSYMAYLESQKKLCYQYVSGDQLKLSEPELLESLNKKIEKCEALLQKLDQ